MKHLIPAVAALLLAGCSAVSNIPTRVHTVDRTIRTSGGTFSASYSGNFADSSCSRAHNGTFSFAGEGVGDFIGSSSETGSLKNRFRNGTCRFHWKGPATLTSAQNPRDTITFSLSETGYTPCVIPPTFVVTGGTGKFVHATGSGKVVLQCRISPNTYSDTWSGTITY